jgi:hypothetical protein
VHPHRNLIWPTGQSSKRPGETLIYYVNLKFTCFIFTIQTFSLTNFAGELTLLTVKNVKKQLVAGMNYIFTVDVLAAPKEGKYHVSVFFMLIVSLVIYS